jgi:hypothetical protein
VELIFRVAKTQNGVCACEDPIHQPEHPPVVVTVSLTPTEGDGSITLSGSPRDFSHLRNGGTIRVKL